jgi:hypothetical protein
VPTVAGTALDDEGLWFSFSPRYPIASGEPEQLLHAPFAIAAKSNADGRDRSYQFVNSNSLPPALSCGGYGRIRDTIDSRGLRSQLSGDGVGKLRARHVHSGAGPKANA